MEMTCMTPANTAGVTCADPSIDTSYGYTYNANGLRMSQTSPGGTTEQLTWNTLSLVPQLLMDGENAYIYGPQGTALGTAPVEQISLSAPNSQSSVTYLVSDPEGVRLTFNSSGTITAGASYDAYGQVITGGLSNVTPFGYAGGYTDPTGLIYLVNRYYDPSTGQFLSVDPLVDLTDQPYQYVGGDPINGSDPSGLGPQPPRLSTSEKNALFNFEHGLPYKEKVLNSALRKIQQAEKYAGKRNAQKRSSNFDWNPLPAIGNALSTAGSAVWNGISTAGKAIWDGISTAGAAIWAGVAAAGATLISLFLNGGAAFAAGMPNGGSSC